VTMSFCSLGRLSQRAEAPEAMIKVRLVHSPSTRRRKGDRLRSAAATVRADIGAEVFSLFLDVLHSDGRRCLPEIRGSSRPG